MDKYFFGIMVSLITALNAFA